MTATPDKRDDNIEGRNIYEIFDHNIAYEIRLQQALEENLLCPFHYFYKVLMSTSPIFLHFVLLYPSLELLFWSTKNYVNA